MPILPVMCFCEKLECVRRIVPLDKFKSQAGFPCMRALFMSPTSFICNYIILNRHGKVQRKEKSHLNMDTCSSLSGRLCSWRKPIVCPSSWIMMCFCNKTEQSVTPTFVKSQCIPWRVFSRKYKWCHPFIIYLFRAHFKCKYIVSYGNQFGLICHMQL